MSTKVLHRPNGKSTNLNLHRDHFCIWRYRSPLVAAAAGVLSLAQCLGHLRNQEARARGLTAQAHILRCTSKHIWELEIEGVLAANARCGELQVPISRNFSGSFSKLFTPATLRITLLYISVRSKALTDIFLMQVSVQYTWKQLVHIV